MKKQNDTLLVNISTLKEEKKIWQQEKEMHEKKMQHQKEAFDILAQEKEQLVKETILQNTLIQEQVSKNIENKKIFENNKALSQEKEQLLMKITDLNIVGKNQSIKSKSKNDELRAEIALLKQEK